VLAKGVRQGSGCWDTAPAAPALLLAPYRGGDVANAIDRPEATRDYAPGWLEPTTVFVLIRSLVRNAGGKPGKERYMRKFKWTFDRRFLFFKVRAVTPVVEGAEAGTVVKGRKLRNRRFTWLAFSPYGTKLIECAFRKDAIDRARAHFKSL
jgi:hypothetical protein